MTPLTLSGVLLFFLTGLCIGRARTLIIGVACALVLGALAADGWFGGMVDTLDGVFNSFIA